MSFRAPLAALVAVAALLAAAPAAGASAPLSQRQELRSGVAIFQYDAAKKRRPALLRSLRGTGEGAHVFRKLRMVAVRGERGELREAARRRGVVAAHMNRDLDYFTNESVPLIYRGSQQDTWSAGFDGRGGAVAVIDSGVDATHGDLRMRTTRNVKVIDPVGALTDDPEPLYVECPAACNTDTTAGHGTHVAGTAAGDGTMSQGFYTGVAPGANIVGLSVGDGINVLYALAAYEYVLEHREELDIVAINNSWGVSDSRADFSDPINQASKAAHDAGITVVFAAGNSASGNEDDPAGASDCGTTADEDGDGAREPSEGPCQYNAYAAAPWVIGVAAARKDGGPEPEDQKLAFFSSRGDPQQETSVDGQPVTYKPDLTASGVNVRAARAPNGATQVICAPNDPVSCVPPRAEYEAFYMPSSGTSMAAPHVSGAVAVIQSVARAELRRLLSPDEVRSVLTNSAAPMPSLDRLYDFPCGLPPFPDCGGEFSGMTGKPYEDWQIGHGHLDMPAAIELTTTLPKKRRRRGR